MVAGQKGRVALGRGLQSLIPAAERQVAPEQGLRKIPVNELLPGDSQPRKYFEDAALAELSSSIAEHGVLQPIVVRRRAGGQFEIVAGERRWRAAKLAGKESIPCVVVDLADEKALTVALVENIQREDLNAIEEAESYRRLSQELGYTQEQVAKAIGKDRSTITNSLRLLKLPSEAQQLVVSKELSMGHARALLSLGEPSLIRETASKIVSEGLSVRETEALVQRALSSESHEKSFKNKELRRLTAGEKEIKRKLESYFGTRVVLRSAEGSGSFVVKFSSEDQLNEILRRMDISL